MSLETVSHSGRLFAPRGDGVTGELVRLLTQHGIQEVQTRVHTLHYRAGTPEGEAFSKDMARFYRVAVPFLQTWTRLPSDYEDIYQQALKEMQEPAFVATWTFLTAWGIKPRDGAPMLMRGLK